VVRLVEFSKRLNTPEIGKNLGTSSHIIWNPLRPSKVYQHGIPKDEFGGWYVSKIPCSKTPPQSWCTYLGGKRLEAPPCPLWVTGCCTLLKVSIPTVAADPFTP
jgi:hypothetical protein